MKTLEEFIDACESYFNKAEKVFSANARLEAEAWFDDGGKLANEPDDVFFGTAKDLADDWNEEI